MSEYASEFIVTDLQNFAQYLVIITKETSDKCANKSITRP